MAKRKPAVPIATLKPAPAPLPRARALQWAPVAALAALALAVYANSIGNGFIGDDQFQLLRNPLLRDFGAIPRIFGSSVWSFLGVTGNYYRPLQFLVYLFIAQIGLHPPAFHAVMVVLHAVNVALLYFLVRRMASGPIAWASAALFAVHPIHTEPVDWIAALPDLMLTTIVLAGVLCFARQKGEPRRRQIAVHCGVYLLALWTKETGVMLLPLYAAFGFFMLGRRWSEFRRNAALYAAMAAVFGIYLAMRISALGSLTPRQQAYFHLAPFDFVVNIVIMAARYLGALMLPVDLNYFHVFHPTHGVTIAFLFAAFALASVAALAVRAATPLIAYGLFWMAASLIPALNLTGIGQNVFTERYLYLPSAGFCWITACAWVWFYQRRPHWAKAAGAAALLLCAFAVIARNRDWRDNFTMLEVTVRQSPDSGWVHDAIAGEYIQRDAFDLALEHERLAVRYDPAMALFHKKLGYILLGKDNAGAVAEFKQVDALEPGVAANHYDLGSAFEAAGDVASAAAEYRKALALQPNYPAAQQGYERVAGKVQ